MTTVAPHRAARAKEVMFPLAVEWLGARRVLVCVSGKPEVVVAPPPEFRGVDPRAWSPEDMFVGAAATCLAVTFTGLAERAPVHLASLHVDGEGTVGTRDDGRFGFTSIRLRLRSTVSPGDVDVAAALARQAEGRCLVAASLALPVEVDVEVRATGGENTLEGGAL
jgi:organic hydroperoxide reductase OsmC/OhrA